jgi:hypothetical protein
VTNCGQVFGWGWAEAGQLGQPHPAESPSHLRALVMKRRTQHDVDLPPLCCPPTAMAAGPMGRKQGACSNSVHPGWLTTGQAVVLLSQQHVCLPECWQLDGTSIVGACGQNSNATSDMRRSTGSCTVPDATTWMRGKTHVGVCDVVCHDVHGLCVMSPAVLQLHWRRQAATAPVDSDVGGRKRRSVQGADDAMQRIEDSIHVVDDTSDEAVPVVAVHAAWWHTLLIAE